MHRAIRYFSKKCAQSETTSSSCALVATLEARIKTIEESGR
jgi:hypothetical protein